MQLLWRNVAGLKPYLANQLPLIQLINQRIDRRLQRAAVLLLLVSPDNQENVSLVFTKRSLHLARNAGQISFPGGMVNNNEQPYEAAIREASEEIGVPKQKVFFLGEMMPVMDSTGTIVVHPFVATMDNTGFLQQELLSNEVQKMLHCPITSLFDSKRLSLENFRESGVFIFNYQIDEQNVVWGLTAQITFRFLEALLFYQRTII